MPKASIMRHAAPKPNPSQRPSAIEFILSRLDKGMPEKDPESLEDVGPSLKDEAQLLLETLRNP